MNRYHGSWPIKVCDVTWRHAIKGWGMLIWCWLYLEHCIKYVLIWPYWQFYREKLELWIKLVVGIGRNESEDSLWWCYVQKCTRNFTQHLFNTEKRKGKGLNSTFQTDFCGGGCCRAWLTILLLVGKERERKG